MSDSEDKFLDQLLEQFREKRDYNEIHTAYLEYVLKRISEAVRSDLPRVRCHSNGTGKYSIEVAPNNAFCLVRGDPSGSTDGVEAAVKGIFGLNALTPELREWALKQASAEEIVTGLKQAREEGGPELGELIKELEQGMPSSERTDT
jgi:hypothetical protein